MAERSKQFTTVLLSQTSIPAKQQPHGLSQAVAGSLTFILRNNGEDRDAAGLNHSHPAHSSIMLHKDVLSHRGCPRAFCSPLPITDLCQGLGKSCTIQNLFKRAPWYTPQCALPSKSSTENIKLIDPQTAADPCK